MEKINVPLVEGATVKIYDILENDVTPSIKTISTLETSLASAWSSTKADTVKGYIAQINSDLSAIKTSLNNVRESVSILAANVREADASATIGEQEVE